MEKGSMMEESNQTGEKEAQAAALQQQVSALLSSALSNSARQRLQNVRLVNQSLYWQAIQALLVLKRSGQLSGQLTDEEMKSLLVRLKPEKREFSIRRK